jgi:hypothetical protein
LGRLIRRLEENIKIELKKKEDGKAWNGFIWLRIGTNSELL